MAGARYCLLLLCLICWQIIKATTVIIYIGPDFVMMATDSKGSYSNTTTFSKESRNIPKIYKTGAVYFSLSGIIANDKRNLDVAALVHQRLKEDKDIATAITRIKKDARSALLAYLSYNKTNNPKLFESNLKVGTYFTSIGLITVKDGRPYAHIIGFKIVNAEKLGVLIDEDYAYSDPNEPTRLLFLGKSDAVNHYLDTARKMEQDPVRLVDKLMKVQMKKSPELVGGPIDIIQINTKEALWIRRKANTPIELK